MLIKDNPYGKMGITASVCTPYDETVTRVKTALKDEGFGVLTEIDVRNTLQAKLGVDFRPYVILGACNPALSHRALSIDPAVGLMLPCNVVVEERDDGCIVSALDPEAGMAAFGNENLLPVAQEAKARLARAIAAVASR